MYESREAEPASDQDPLEAGRVIAWLKDGGAVERALQSALGGLPSERDATLARMGDVLQATARGLGPEAAALWADVPEPVLKGWIDKDPAFAAALYGATALAAAHKVKQDSQPTPAMLRVLLLAMSNGATKRDALKPAGFQESRLRALVKASSPLKALLDTARRARPPQVRHAGVRGPGRPRHPGRKAPEPWGFRLVQRDGTEDQAD
ncbi:hypothetical protein [Streptomyces sp. BF23-18]|uniref:hypothetical protein n=1 Tax=unclassified Streptomyces TaxID=2593676 RepID=UPI0034E5253D